jgi:hypothetical protein
MKKGVVPAGAVLAPDADAKFEEIADRELKRLGLAGLDRAVGFWRLLAKAHPSTRRRLIVECLKLSADVPRKLIPFIEAELGTSTAPRTRIRTPDQMRLAARHLVRHPGSSLSEIARAMGSPGKKTTIASYFDRDEFWKLCAEEMLLHDRSRQYTILADYEERFGQLDDGAPDFFHRDGDVPLCYLVPLMLDAIEGRRGALDRSTIKNAPEAYAVRQQRDALKETLAGHH